MLNPCYLCVFFTHKHLFAHFKIHFLRRMLESHMDDETKRQLLDKIDEIEREGLAYQQHGG